MSDPQSKRAELPSEIGTAKQLADVARQFEKERTGRMPVSVTAALADNSLVITLCGELSPAEIDLAKTPDGAAEVQELHRQLFRSSKEVAVGEIKAHIAVKPGDQETAVRFHLVDASDKPVGDLQPYLGAMGHLVIISADGREYVHAHPLSEAKTAPDGAVEFAAHFPKPGIYKAWGQFQRDGSVFTVPFVLEHKGGKPMSHQEGN